MWQSYVIETAGGVRIERQTRALPVTLRIVGAGAWEVWVGGERRTDSGSDATRQRALKNLERETWVAMAARENNDVYLT